MLVLVTGGSGFIGSHVVDKLVGRGTAVRVFDLIPPSFRSDVEFCEGDILDIGRLKEALAGVDAVVHLAAVADVKDVFESPKQAEEVNVRGTINVLEAMRFVDVSQIIYGSTIWVYSDCDEDQVDENTAIRPPAHLYTATKYASELYCNAYSNLYDMEFTVLRFGVPYGPRSRDGAVLPIFVKRALAGDPLTIAGDGSQFRKFLYVEDLAEGVALAASKAARNRIYNLDGAERISVRQIAETVRSAVGDVAIQQVEGRTGDFSGKEVSSERARQDLGWEPMVSFDEGVRRYIQWYRQRQQEQHKE